MGCVTITNPYLMLLRAKHEGGFAEAATFHADALSTPEHTP